MIYGTLKIIETHKCPLKLLFSLSLGITGKKENGKFTISSQRITVFITIYNRLLNNVSVFNEL